MGGGADYQARVSAWVAVHLLAEEDAEPPFRLAAPVAQIACESPEPVDDLIVTTRTRHTAYVQVKTDRFPFLRWASRRETRAVCLGRGSIRSAVPARENGTGGR